jgi:recombination protein RecR
MDYLRRLEENFTHFPGIGPRQARRFVYYLLSRSNSSIRELVDLIYSVKNASRECHKCHRFFIVNTNIKSNDNCGICMDASRDPSTLMVLARDSDLESVEKSGAYKGLYFVLGGIVPIMDKEPDKRIRLKSLLDRISDTVEIKEVILSLNTTPDGENTEDIVKHSLLLLQEKRDIKISILGRGLSKGAELEYADQDTIKNALLNRH